jgi:hypothetical protein
MRHPSANKEGKRELMISLIERNPDREASVYSLSAGKEAFFQKV